MSKQLTLGEGFEKYAKTTRRGQFLNEMDSIIPWAELCELIAPVYPVAGNGRPPRELEMMLRIYFLQQWFNLSDPAAEDMLYDSVAMQRFVGLDLGESPAPDETTICRFRHLLERNDLGEALFQYVLDYLEAQGIKVGKGTIVDASIISAPASTKNKDGKRDPDMHQAKKGNQWFFGMKAHIGVDSRTKLIHAVAATAANVHDATCLPDLLHGEETKVWGDAAYQGQGEVIKDCAPDAQDMTHRRTRRQGEVDEVERGKNTTKSRVRAKVEHPFLVIKQIFGFSRTRYRGLEKNAHRLFVTCALTNLYLMRRRLLRMA
ncbi:MAG: IS5 family transposase [Candidatus Marinimicrobia bacterium]|jgi:IS5 family transposase|nr:IS5 family transposase [Candidatus Neomarinimicrobiota bacterium]|tara:strand:+ start:95 stop:1048 length:954 start_codon:yes stop_codon:yes gene_type:complete